MKKHNFTQNELINLSTRRGEVKVKIRFDKMIPDGMVFMPFCFENAPVNLLTNQALRSRRKNSRIKILCSKD